MAIAQTFYVLLALLGIGFVIIIHELGHFLAARLAGVKVLIFSVGFGPPLWRRMIGSTEFRFSALPFGGYVMVQEEDDPQAPPEARGRSVAGVGFWWKALYLGAGVLFNFVSSLLILMLLAWRGLPAEPPVVGEVQLQTRDQHGVLVESAASRLGLRPGDRVLEANGRTVETYLHLKLAVIDAGAGPVRLRVRRGDQILDLPAEGPGVPPVYSRDEGLGTLGIQPAAANLITASAGGEDLTGWTITAIDGQAVAGRPGQVVTEEVLLERIGRTVAFDLEREGKVRRVETLYAGEIGDAGWSALGLPVRIAQVLPGTPAEAAGLRAGEIITAVDGVAPSSTSHLRSLIRRGAAAGRPLRLDLAGLDLAPRSVDLAATLDPRTGVLRIGIALAPLAAGAVPALPPALASDRRPLAEAGLEAGDVLLELWRDEAGADDGKPPRLDLPVTVLALRGGTTRVLEVGDADRSALADRHEPGVLAKMFLFRRPVTPLAERLAGSRVLGVDGTALQVRSFRAGQAPVAGRLDLAALSPALRDALCALPVGAWIAVVRQDGIEVRDGCPLEEPLEFTVRPAPAGTALAFLQYAKEVRPVRTLLDPARIAWDESSRILTTTLNIIPRFFRSAESGGVDSSKSLQGPVGIFRTLRAGVEERGLAGFLHLLAVLGLNLVLINLLPLPIADGGRLVIVSIEAVLRRRLPARTINAILLGGMVLIVALIIYVFGLDLLRAFGLH